MSKNRYFPNPIIRMNLVAEINSNEEIVKEIPVDIIQVDFDFRKMDISYIMKIDGRLSKKNKTVDYTPFMDYLEKLKDRK